MSMEGLATGPPCPSDSRGATAAPWRSWKDRHSGLSRDFHAGAVIEGRGRRDDHALAGAHAIEDLAMATGGSSRRDRAALDLTVDIDEDHSRRALAAHGLDGDEHGARGRRRRPRP